MRDFAKEKPYILIVDDEAINRIVVSKMLTKDYVSKEAASGEEALDLVREKHPDLILLDVHMPGMSGHDVIKSLKNDKTTADIPVVFMTADDDSATEANSLMEGASDYITKPCRKDILLARINRIIELDFLQNNLKEEVKRQTAKAEERSRRIEQMSLQTVQTLAEAIDAKDQYTKGHSTRVSQYSMILAKTIGWDDERIDNLRYSALLHDVGKIGIPDAIINNPKKLKETEYDVIKSHTTLGGEILKNNVMIVGAEDVALHHHERFDGSGYPEGLAGEDISLEARIVAIADAYDAMRSRRIYRKALTPEKIRQELTEGRGGQFDPNLVDVFMKLIDEGKLDSVSRGSETVDYDSMEDSSVLLQKVMESFVAQNAIDEIDVTTGLLSRTFGERAIAEAMQEEEGCFAFVDVDNLKKINDTMGHHAGDLVLKLVGDIVRSHAGNAVSCRLGGDEFIIFLKGVDKDAADERVKEITEAFTNAKNKIPEIKASSLSSGLVMCTPDDTYIDVYNKADKALYHVKQNGKEGYFFYKEEEETDEAGGVDMDRLVYGIKNSGKYYGAMEVEYRHFAKLFEYLANLQKRHRHNFKLVLITIEPTSGEKAYIDELEHAMYCMEESIKLAIRNVDVVTRYSSVQFLVMLVEPGSNSEVKIILDRIFQGYYKMCGSNKFLPLFTVADPENYNGENTDKEEQT